MSISFGVLSTTEGKNFVNKLKPFQFNIATAVFIYILENLLQTYNIG